MEIKKINELYSGFFKMLEASIETSDGVSIKREIFTRESVKNSGDGVAAIVYDIKKKKYIFVKQFRVGLYKSDDKYITEVVAGTLENGEDVKDCIVREIEEELGYSTDNILPIGEFYVSPGGCTEKVYLYEAFVSEKVASGGGLPEEYEEIETIEMTRDEMLEFTFTDAKTIIGVNHAIKTTENKNIYTILEEIEFEKRCDDIKTNMDRGVDVKQALFSLVQKFQENMLK